MTAAEQAANAQAVADLEAARARAAEILAAADEAAANLHELTGGQQ